jgi:putative integral membrane protein (TIGR02587 family)
MATGRLREAIEEQGRRRAGWRTPAESLGEYGRGVAGGLIFSLPLLYTQEVWELGTSSSPLRLGVGLAVTVLLLLGYNRYGGLRSDASFAEVVIDSVEELGLGLLIAAAVLWLIGVLEPGMSPTTALGAIVLEGLLVAIGVSVGTAQLGGGGGDDDAGMQGDQEQESGVFSELALGSCGAVLIAANVAPTEEIRRIASAIDGPQLLALVALGLILTAVIGFYSDFAGSGGGERPSAGAIVRSVVIGYAVALGVAAGLLWFFGQLDGMAPVPALERVVVLSVPAALGASAGRLLLQSDR